MAFLTTAGLVLSAGSSINQFIQGNKIAKAAERELDNFQYQELTNLAERLKPSFEAERQLRVQTSEMLATASDVAQGRDIAGALGILGMGYQQAQKSQLQGLTSMLEKDYQADLERVRDEQAMRQMRETRDMERLQSLKAQAMSGEEMKVDALTGLATTAVSAGLTQEAIDAQAGIDDKTKSRFKDLMDQANATETVSDVLNPDANKATSGSDKLSLDDGVQSSVLENSINKSLLGGFLPSYQQGTRGGIKGAINESILNAPPMSEIDQYYTYNSLNPNLLPNSNIANVYKNRYNRSGLTTLGLSKPFYL